MTSCDMSTLFCRSSEMTCLTYLWGEGGERSAPTRVEEEGKTETYSSAPLTSRSISILWRHVSMTVCTSRQLSRRTVCSREARGEVASVSIVDRGARATRTGARRTHLDALGVHLVVLVGPRPVQAGVALLVDEQVRKVDLLELELDGLDELGRDEIGRLGAWVKRGMKTASAGHARGGASSRKDDGPSDMAVSRSGQPNLTMTESVSP